MIQQTYPSLPDGMKRFGVERLILEVGPHIGLRPGAIQALLHMIRATRPTDWIKDDREPVYFASQATLSMELAKTPRAIRNIENKLESASLIEKRVKANGHRGRSGGCGITFRRLIRAVPALIDLAQRIKDEHQERKELIERRSTLNRLISRSLIDIEMVSTESADRLRSDLALWPKSPPPPLDYGVRQPPRPPQRSD